jgi:hypothetical protein
MDDDALPLLGVGQHLVERAEPLAHLAGLALQRLGLLLLGGELGRGLVVHLLHEMTLLEQVHQLLLVLVLLGHLGLALAALEQVGEGHQRMLLMRAGSPPRPRWAR